MVSMATESVISSACAVSRKLRQHIEALGGILLLEAYKHRNRSGKYRAFPDPPERGRKAISGPEPESLASPG